MQFLIFSLSSSVQGDSLHNAMMTDTFTDDLRLIHPHVVTITNLENLLKRAGNIFRPEIEHVKEKTVHPSQEQSQLSSGPPVPYENMQPPKDQPFNYYMPLYDTDVTYSMSDKMHKISPPLKSAKGMANFAETKPKKIPKKFNALQKHINMKWLNLYEKEKTNDPNPFYSESDERQRINFDDSFFGVDMLLNLPGHQSQTETKIMDKQKDSNIGDDLMAKVTSPIATANFK